MLVLFFVFFRAVESQECKLNNTMMGLDGKCICKPGFVGPKNLTKHGCWTCSPVCTYNALCHYPGFCKCKPGYEGDGVTVCKPFLSAPELVDFHPRSTPVNVPTSVTVTFRSSNTAKSSTGMARFGYQVTICDIPRDDVMICQVPSSNIGPVSFAISFDGNHWSTGGHVFTYLPGKLSFSSLLSGIGLFALCCLCVLSVYVYLSNKKKSPRAFSNSGPTKMPPARFI